MIEEKWQSQTELFCMLFLNYVVHSSYAVTYRMMQGTQLFY